MTETSGYLAAADETNVYTQNQLAAVARDIRTNGLVWDGTYNEFLVEQQASPDMTVKVDTGEAWIQGYFYRSTASQNVTISTADATFPRIDLVVLRNNITGSRKIDATVITGTPASSPVAPDYSRTDDVWDLVLAEIAVAAGATTVVTANITDRRTSATLCGESNPYTVRISDIRTGAAWDLDTHKLTNVGLCTADNDASTYDYIESIDIPPGYICAYPGLVVPSGWLECNGGTFDPVIYPGLYTQLGSVTLPDLRGRIPFGYKGSGYFPTIGYTGGSATVTLTTANLPSHSHTGTWRYERKYSADMVYEGYGTEVPTTSGSTGGGGAHENRPPSMVLKWIIRAV
jgi:microcystin-dependent protein